MQIQNYEEHVGGSSRELMVGADFQLGLSSVPFRPNLVQCKMIFSNNAAFKMNWAVFYQLECKFHEGANVIFTFFIH